MNSGSREGLKVSLRCGAKAKARHSRWTLLRLRPQAPASERLLQCLSFLGVDSSVIVNTRSTSASLSRRVPSRGSSNKPSSLLFRKRVRHLPIVCLVTRKRSATVVLLAPAALRQCLSCLRSPRPLLQRLPFIVAQAQRWYRSSCSHQFLLYN
jgi:hypothetical protein